MNRGLLLLSYDNSARDLEVKVTRAAQYYRERFGKDPNVCYVHPADLPDGECDTNGVRVRTSANVLRHHFWAGYEPSEVTQ